MSLVNVRKVFDLAVAVDGVTFDIVRNEFFSMLGPSGCGKTTTLRMLAGFEEPTSGHILIEGENAGSFPPYRRKTNLVFQNYALFPHMTVYDNVAFGPRRKKLRRREVDATVREFLETVRLDEYSARKPRELSGGQQQRVALARALANRPAVLLLDEPLGALDLSLREEMQFELKRIQRETGISFVYVTHDQNEALTMSDRIAVMRNGVVEHLASPEKIYLEPETLFVAKFIGQANLLPCTVEAADGGSFDVRFAGGERGRAAKASYRPDPGTAASLMIRPEHITLHAAPPNSGEGLRVRLGQETFQGAVVRCQGTLGDGTPIVMLIRLEDRFDPRPADDTSWISWNPERAYLLPAESDGSFTDSP
ncbi:MAG: ABC transporter ATP-binding protein [Gaiellaceae bacterium MAG52_C11]|nr:ABC transporter ATP-binding protein [Candidatus Gaiellasilicea maunaloa]